MQVRCLQISAFLLTGIVLVLPLQAQNTPAPVKPLVFETVSIKPADPNTKMRMWGVQPNMYRSLGMPLNIAVTMAFIKQGYPARDLLQGMPTWMSSDWYDIVGKFDESTTEAFGKMSVTERQENIKPMIQAILVDRCKLIFHRVPTEIQGFALVVSKGGPKLTPAVEGEAAADRAVPLASGGKMVPFMPNQPAVLHFFHATMADLVRQMSSGVPVLDQTGISGQFNFGVPRTEQDNPVLDFDADAYTRRIFWMSHLLGLN